MNLCHLNWRARVPKRTGAVAFRPKLFGPHNPRKASGIGEMIQRHKARADACDESLCSSSSLIALGLAPDAVAALADPPQLRRPEALASRARRIRPGSSWVCGKFALSGSRIALPSTIAMP